VVLFEGVCGVAEDRVAVYIGPVVQDAAEVVPAGALRELDQAGRLSGAALLTCYRLGREETMDHCFKAKRGFVEAADNGLEVLENEYSW
jgi:hypothetical protein